MEKGIKAYSIRENLEDIIKEQLSQCVKNENNISNNEEKIKNTKGIIEKLFALLQAGDSTVIDLKQAADIAVELCTACYDLITVLRKEANQKNK